MYYTGIDPRDMSPVYAATDPHEKALQRALLQWFRPELRKLVIEALQKAGREDLIGFGPKCLVKPYGSTKPLDERKAPRGDSAPKKRAAAKPTAKPTAKRTESKKEADKPKKLVRKAGWAKPKAKTGKKK